MLLAKALLTLFLYIKVCNQRQSARPIKVTHLALSVHSISLSNKTSRVGISVNMKILLVLLFFCSVGIGSPSFFTELEDLEDVVDGTGAATEGKK